MGLPRHISVLLDTGYSARAYLIAITVIILIPALTVGGWLASGSAISERTQLEHAAHQKAREITAEIDREIIGLQNMLTILGSSHVLETGDVEAFYRQASEISRQLGIQIVLRDSQRSMQLLNTAFPWGAPLDINPPPMGRDVHEEAFRSGRPVVSNVFFAPRSKRFVVGVVAPVVRNGTADYMLAIGVPVQKFAEILNLAQPGSDRIMTILDRKNAIVARSEKHGEFAGRTVALAPPLEPQGVVNAKSKDGVPTHWFYRRSDVTGWVISVGIPDHVLEAPSKLALVTYASASSLLFAVAIALSYHLGGRIPHSGALGIDRKPTLEEFRVLFESAPNGVLVIDSDGHIALLNAQMERMFGYAREELIGKSVETLVPDRFRTQHSELRKGFAVNAQARPMGAGRDLFGLRSDRSEFPIEIGLNPIATPAGNLVMATVVDVTARKRAAEWLSVALAERDELRRRFMQAQEEERLRLAHELHDQTGQGLAAAMLELKGIEPLVQKDGRERLRLLHRQLEDMGKTLHHVASELRPASIDDLGLATTLANYIQDWSEQFNIETDFHCGAAELDRLPDAMRTAIYRIVQEALTNIAKHAPEATTVGVVLDRSESQLQLTIEDNGGGFDLTLADTEKGKNRRLGLAGMRERLALVGGELEIESSPGAGTTLFARIPLDRRG